MDASEIQQTVKMALIAITLHAFSLAFNAPRDHDFVSIKI